MIDPSHRRPNDMRVAPGRMTLAGRRWLVAQHGAAQQDAHEIADLAAIGAAAAAVTDMPNRAAALTADIPDRAAAGRRAPVDPLRVGHADADEEREKDKRTHAGREAGKMS